MVWRVYWQARVPRICSPPGAFVIGQSLPLTGSNAAFGLDVKAGVGAFLAAAAKRSPGIKFAYSVLDDQNTPEAAAANTKKLISDGCGVLFGYASATIAKPCIPLAEAAKIPVYAPFTGARSVHRGTSPWVFTARASYDVEAAKFAEFFLASSVKRVAVIHYDDAVGVENNATCVETMQKAGLVVVSVAIQRNAAVPAGTAAKIAALTPDAVVFTTLAAASAALIRELRSMLRSQVTYAALSFVGMSALQAALGDESIGIVVSHVVPQYWKTAIEVVRDYHAANTEANTGRKPSFAGLEAFIALRGLEQALSASRSNDGTALAQSLATTKVDLGGVTLDFTKAKYHGGSYVGSSVILGKNYPE